MGLWVTAFIEFGKKGLWKLCCHILLSTGIMSSDVVGEGKGALVPLPILQEKKMCNEEKEESH